MAPGSRFLENPGAGGDGAVHGMEEGIVEKWTGFSRYVPDDNRSADGTTMAPDLPPLFLI